jgi:uncharacterized protein (DUF1501 family)
MKTTRRFFLKSSGLAMAGFAAAPSFLVRTAFAQSSASREKDRPIVIAIFQRGAADGISMVVPFGDKNYYSVRPQIAIPAPAAADAESAIDLDGFFGLHPAMSALKPIYDERHLAIVHAAGSPSNTRSHFDAQDYMEAGTPGNKGVTDGWMNRYMQANPDRDATPFRGVAFSANMPRSLIGSAPAVAMTRIADFGVRAGVASNEVAKAFEAMYGGDNTGKETFEAVKMLKQSNPQRFAPENGAEYPTSGYGQALLQIVQLIKADIGLQVAFADIGGWDTHANQGNARGQMANRLRELAQGLAALYRDLGDRARSVIVVTMTEFGRAIRQNGSGGTDHGHASALFVMGGPVRGGKVYGKWPGLAPEQLYESRDLALTTDFRDVFAEILVKHMRATDIERVFPGFKPGPGLQVL